MRRGRVIGWVLIFVLLFPLVALATSGTVYVVQPGDTLWGIARRFGVSPYAIARANGISPRSFVYVGQRLLIPGQQGSSGYRVYVVKAGDTLSGIAARFGVSLRALAQANGLTVHSFVYIGQRLRIPARGTAAPSRPTPSGRIYVVQPGDTLSHIAARFGVSLSALIRANRLTNPSLIYVGQRLVIPRRGAVGPVTSYGLKFVVHVSSQRCSLYQGDILLYNWRCSTGRPGYPTRYGTFHVQRKLPVAYGGTWNIYMPYWLGIYWAGGTENGIHGLPWNARTGVKVWSGWVGRPITYGCIMLDDWAARTLYERAYIGMPVIIRP